MNTFLAISLYLRLFTFEPRTIFVCKYILDKYYLWGVFCFRNFVIGMYFVCLLQFSLLVLVGHE